MPNINIKQIRVANRYADALFEEASQCDKTELVLKDLTEIVNSFDENNELKDFLTNPIVTIADKKDVINQIYRNDSDDVTFNFLMLLADNGRFDVIKAVLVRFKDKLDELNNIVKVNVTSAVEINDDLKNRLVQKLESKTSKKVVADYHIEPKIIGGLIVEINDKTIDSSLKTKLRNMQKQLI